MVRSIVFDIGNVLLFTDWERAAGFLTERCGVPKEKTLSLFWGGGWHGRSLEHFLNLNEGSLDEFHRIAEAELGTKIPRDTFWDFWHSEFIPNVPMMRLALELGLPTQSASEERPRLYICSNINAPHWLYLQCQFKVFDIFRGAALSYEVGAMKPDARMFLATENLIAVSPRYSRIPSRSEILYVDDRVENIEAAQRHGWQTFLYRHGNEGALRKTLRDGGIDISGE